MNPERVAEFPISPSLRLLNHASFGVMTNVVMQAAGEIRAELEADSLALVDVDALVPRLRRAADAVARQLELRSGAVALTQNATSAGAALMRSLPLARGDRVVVLSTEYDSIVRGWQVRCEETGAAFQRLTVPIPVLSTSQLLDALDEQVHGEVHVAQLSLVSSSTAIAFPVQELAAWFAERGAVVVLDVAHGPGHVPLCPAQWGVAAMFGTLHKWFPTPRPVGLLWVDDRLEGTVRPAEVSLTWDSPDLVERFSWPGTFDPTPRLCVETAIAEWNAWHAAGDLDRCEKLAEYASERLGRVGAPTTDRDLLAPRMRSFTLAGCSRAALRDALAEAGIRAWAGTGPEGETMLRVATHVYNDESDVDLLADVIAGIGEGA